MTTIFKYLLAITLLIGTITSAEAKIVSVEVTGYGITHKLAVIEGLKEALAQVSGISINAIDETSLTSIVAEQKKDDDITSKQMFKKETQSGILTKTNGYVSSYQIISSNRDGENYQVDMVVEIEKYDVPGKNDNRRSIAIIGFKAKNSKCYGKDLSANDQIEEITDTLVNTFTSTRKFSVLDRKNDDVYAFEKELILSEDAKGSEAAKLGQVKGTDYIVTGTIKSLKIDATKQKISISGDTFTTYSASAIVDFKLLTFANRQVKFASSVQVSLNNSEISGKGCKDVLSLLMQKISTQIVDKCIENIYPPLVVNVNGNNVYLNIGGESIKKDALYNVYAIGEKIIDPYTGESLGAEETQIAILKISEVKPKYSVGIIVEGQISDIQKGQICRPKVVEKKTTTAPKKVKRKISENDW